MQTYTQTDATARATTVGGNINVACLDVSKNYDM